MASCFICGDSSAQRQQQDDRDKVNKFVKQLGIQGQGLSASQMTLCEDCKSGLLKASERGEHLREVEEDVRRLQRQILGKMRELKSIQADYLEQMRRLGGKISRCTLGGKGRGRKNKKRGSGDTGKGEAIRKGISNVVKDLGAYQEGLSAQPLCATEQPATPTGSSAMDSSDIKTEFDPLEVVDVSLDAEKCLSPTQELPSSASDDDKISGRRVVAASSSKRAAGAIRKSKGKDNGKRYFACDFCEKSFLKSSHLKTHVMAVHKEDRPFQCNICPKKFAYIHVRDRHQLTHSGKKLFTCPKCGKGFGRKDYLEKHERSHRREREFVCPFCGEDYVLKHHLNRHLKYEHSGKTLDD